MRFSDFIYRFWFYLKPHIGKFAITSIMMIVSALTQVAQPELLRRITDDVFLTDASSRDASLALFYTLLLLTLFIAYAAANFISNANNSAISSHIIKQLRDQMFDKILKLPKSYFDQHTTGKILSKLTYDVEQIASTASSLWITLIRDSITVIGLLVYLLMVNWRLSLAVWLILPIIALVLKKAARHLKQLSRDLQYSMGSLTHILDENISNQSLVKIYHAQAQQSRKINELTNTLRKKNFKLAITDNLNSVLIYVLIGLGLGMSIYIASIPFAMSAGEFIAFSTAFAMLISPSKNLANLNKPLQKAMAASQSIFSLLDEKGEANPNTTPLKHTKGKIVFDNVSFGYAKALVLKHINLSINAGETVALVGSTGSGKSTLVQLLCRFYQPSEGKITIDDQDITQIDINSLRKNIAFVDQKTALFNDTVGGNIALGQQQIDHQTIVNAAKTANAYDFINQLDNQFDTPIGEDGLKLSGGQRQRLAIARAIAKHAPILILDEATSALDSTTEKKVQQAIERAQQHCTTIVIAHRLSTIEKADKIVVLKHGRIIESGTHQQLISQRGEYAQLYHSQFQ